MLEIIQKLILIAVTGFIVFLVLILSMNAIDKITVRDCDRGITSACEYIK